MITTRLHGQSPASPGTRPSHVTWAREGAARQRRCTRGTRGPARRRWCCWTWLDVARRRAGPAEQNRGNRSPTSGGSCGALLNQLAVEGLVQGDEASDVVALHHPGAAARSMARPASGFSISLSIAAASAGTSPMRTRIPESVPMSSALPRAVETIAGTPSASASMTARARPSRSLARTSAVAVATSGRTSATIPRKWTRSATPSPPASDSRRPRSGPSPASSRCAPRCRMVASAVMASPTRLRGACSATTANTGASAGTPASSRTRAVAPGSTLDRAYRSVSTPIPGMWTRWWRGTIRARAAAASSSSLITTRRSVQRPAIRSAVRNTVFVTGFPPL